MEDHKVYLQGIWFKNDHIGIPADLEVENRSLAGLIEKRWCNFMDLATRMRIRQVRSVYM
jgi:hypothetical protein